MRTRSRAGGKTAKPRRRKPPQPKRRNAPKGMERSSTPSPRPDIEVSRLSRELNEAVEQQAATSEVLDVISRSPGDLEPVFAKILKNAVRVCEANFGVLTLYEGEDRFRVVAMHNVPPAYRRATAA
jgi:hypothetical protein